MTCIVAVKDNNGNFAMAADRMICTNNNVGTTVYPKIWEHIDVFGNKVLIGAAGTWAKCQAIRYGLEMPDTVPDDVDVIMNVQFPRLVRECVENTDIEDSHFQLLIIIRNRIFVMGDEHTIQEINGTYYSIGSGMDFALGSLHANSYMGELLGIRTLAERAILAACELDDSCSLPIDILSSHT